MIARQRKEFIKDALWISYTGLKDFLRCPRSFYLKNRYRDPKTGNKLQIAFGPMTLGSVVHDAIKWYLQTNRTADKDQVIVQFRHFWQKYRGKRGGFRSREEEGDFGRRGLAMLDNFMKNAGLLESNVPAYNFLRYQLGEKIVLSGKVDFIGKLPDNSLHVLDFKTGASEENDSTQLHTYAIMAESNFQRPVTKISFWYLDKDNLSKEAVLDSLEEKIDWLKNKALEIQQAVEKDGWVCIRGDEMCFDCRNYQAIIEGKGEFQYSDEDFRKDVYFFSSQ